MTAIPVIPADVVTLDQLDAWIDRHAPKAHTLADRLRMHVAIMVWAAAYRERLEAPRGR